MFLKPGEVLVLDRVDSSLAHEDELTCERAIMIRKLLALVLHREQPRRCYLSLILPLILCSAAGVLV